MGPRRLHPPSALLPLLGAALAAGAGSAALSEPRAAPGLAASAHAVLAKRCFSCHGPARTAGLDLRTRAGALRGGGRGPALAPGKAEESRLYQLVQGKAGPRMPPGTPLPEGERELLRRWIDAGAPFPGAPRPSGGMKDEGGRMKGEPSHPSSLIPYPSGRWAFRPLKAPPAPKVRNRAWVRNPIDAFVLAGLEAKGLQPAPTADRRTLIRRLSFDLTGLPPTPAEVERFLADRSATAYENLVDRLLASPRYGERWGRHWLDVVRFAESQGFERDKIRDNAWRYRDWVIRAFNDDVPYDRFVREQLAGDVLPNRTGGSITATGFLVAGPWDEVGSAQASAVMRARVREDELEDMVGAVGQTFLGLTVNCARCHDHKFDPIPQRDYYRLQACLAGVKHGDRSILLPTEDAVREKALAQALRRLQELQRESDALLQTSVRRVLEQRRTPGGAATPDFRVRPVLRWSFENGARDSISGVELSLSGGASLSGGTLRLNGSTAKAESAPLPVFLSSKTLEVWVRLADPDQRGGSALTVETPGVFDAVVFGERQPRRWAAGSELFRRTRDLEAADENSPAGVPVHVAVAYAADGRISVYRNGEPYGAAYVSTDDPKLRTFPAGKSHVLFGLRHTGAGGAAWLAGEIYEARVYDRALSGEEVRASFRAGPEPITEQERLAALTPEERARRATLDQELKQARAAAGELSAIPMAYAANSNTPPEVHLLKRGDALQKGELLTPGALSCLDDLPGDLGLAAGAPDAERRLKLAEWITSAANPLTPRVMVNRVWQYHFGRGLAPSPSDFGVNGERPSHPGLLDWLGYVFIRSDGEGQRGGSLLHVSEGEKERRRDAERPSTHLSLSFHPSGSPSNRQNPSRHAGAVSPSLHLSPSNRQNPSRHAGAVSPSLHFSVAPSNRQNPSRHAGAVSPSLLRSVAPSAREYACGWSLKKLHRLIVTSSTYKQSGRFDPKAAAVDADNRLLWRRAPERLDAEEIRDSLLAASGQLNLQAGGPGFRPFNVFVNNSHFYTYEDKVGPEFNRRSVYRTVVNSGGIPLLETFDCPDPSVKTPRRGSTTTPLQALALLNDSFVLRQARECAKSLAAETGPDPAREVSAAYRRVLNRPPTSQESSRAVRFVREHGLAAFCRVLFNSSEFVYVR